MNNTNKSERVRLDMQELRLLFSTPRFAGTQGELQSIRRLRKRLGLKQDDYGNLYKRVGETSTMFSCHTDTVHKQTATSGYSLDEADGYVRVKGGGVLGADCGAGWMLMLHMLEAGIPGLYVWHREEEIGGGGSMFFAENMRHELGGIQRCVAFDRAGYTDVITHQSGLECCSETFATALSMALNANMPPRLQFAPDAGGVFTDSHNYRGIIPECTNISVGYFGQHTRKEYQDLFFLEMLLQALLSVQWEELPTVRTPQDDDEFNWMDDGYDSLDELNKVAILVQDKPYETADLLMQLGYTYFALQKEI